MDKDTRSVAELLLIGSSHNYRCRCETCLQWWISVGHEDNGDGTWGFGPFTQAEYEAAGGQVPAFGPDEYYNEPIHDLPDEFEVPDLFIQELEQEGYPIP